MKKRLLILTDKEQNTLLETKILNETDNITYTIVDNPPVIEEIDGKIGKYVLGDNGKLTVKYTDIPKTDIEILQEENDALTQRMSELQETLASFILEGADK